MPSNIPFEVLSVGQDQCSPGKNFNLSAVANETIPEVRERLQDYILACPHHGMDNWLILQSFYNGLTPTARGHIYAAGGAFSSVSIAEETKLIEKMVFKQGWSDDRL
jgi:hypothetical protein